ncbi:MULTISPECIES: DUF1707 domain-containing protein [unclassified Nocardia]|uniref:DUF1707 SHOCT-like domain-containing protein n=1 Tax=unclassified Nocardia TaxID=2637762 RepID=UPI0035D9A4C2
MQPYWNPAQLRAGDADRERVIEGLNQCFSDGRITADELSERIGQTFNARTFADLDMVLTGLPVVRPRPPMPGMSVIPGNAPMYYRQHRQQQWNGMGLTAFMLGLFGFVCGITAIPAVALGAAAIAIDPKRQDKGFAIAGVAAGGFWLLLFALLMLN